MGLSTNTPKKYKAATFKKNNNMKNTLLFFILCSLSAQAQTLTKSFVLSPDGINYLEVVRETDEVTGSYSESGVLIGPIAQIASNQADKILQRIEAIANQAFAVSTTNGKIAQEKAVSASIFALTGIDPLKVIQSKYAAWLTQPGWTIDPGTGYVPIVFTVNASNVLRCSINGAAAKVVEMYGNIIRINGYPDIGANTDFFRSEDGGVYFSLPNRIMKIKRP